MALGLETISKRSGRPLLPAVALVFLAGWVLLATTTHAAEPDPQCVPSVADRMFQGQTIGILFEDDRLARDVRQAVELWSSCEAPRGMPSFLVGQAGDRNLYVRREMRSLGRRCGVFRGNEIVLYRYSVRSNGSKRSCGDAALNLAHELGHVLGLDDAPRTLACRHHIMAKLSPNNLFRRSVKRAECRAARGFNRQPPLRLASP